VQALQEAGGVKALPLPSIVKLVPPLKTPSFLPEVKSKGSGGTSRGASPEYHSLEAPSPQGEREPRFSDVARAKEDLQQRSPQPESKAKRKEQEIKAERNEEERKAAREAKAEHSEELAIVGEVSWVGVICKVESNTQVRTCVQRSESKTRLYYKLTHVRDMCACMHTSRRMHMCVRAWRRPERTRAHVCAHAC
jgi:hypothetical protein